MAEMNVNVVENEVPAPVQAQPTIPQPPSGFQLWRADRLPHLRLERPHASEPELAQTLKIEWGGMNGQQQQPFHQASQAASVESGYHTADLLCIFCMRRSADPAAHGWVQLPNEHALDFATGAYGADAQLAMSTFMASRNGSCWFCPACPPGMGNY